MTSHRIPIIGHHRGVGLHNFQDEARLQRVRSDIDAVFELQGIRELCDFARDPAHAPEARIFAAALAEARTRHNVLKRRRQQVALDYIQAIVAGLDSEVWRDETHYGTIAEAYNAITDAKAADCPVARDRPLPSLEERLRAADTGKPD